MPERRNLVLSRGGFAVPGVETVPSIDAACALVAGEPELVIIGGAQLYQQALPQLHTIHLTRVHCVLDGDTHLPALPDSKWREVAREEKGGGCAQLLCDELCDAAEGCRVPASAQCLVIRGSAGQQPAD